MAGMPGYFSSGSIDATWDSTGQAKDVFRYTESIIQHKLTIGAGNFATFDYRGSKITPDALDVSQVSWDIFAKSDEDLEEVLWSLDLFWGFRGCTILIAPLSFFGGTAASLMEDRTNRPNLGPASELEKLGAVAREEEFTANLNDFRLGNGRLYRGQMVYTRAPVRLPPSTPWEICVIASTPLILKADVKLKINIVGALKTAVEIG